RDSGNRFAQSVAQVRKEAVSFSLKAPILKIIGGTGEHAMIVSGAFAEIVGPDDRAERLVFRSAQHRLMIKLLREDGRTKIFDADIGADTHERTEYTVGIIGIGLNIEMAV